MDYSLFGLASATRGMAAAQAALDTAGNNLANANTEGYSRRRVEMVPAPAMTMASIHSPISLAQMGGGVAVTNIVRVRDQFLDVRIRQQQAALGANNTMRDQVNFVESQFQEPSDSGLAANMTAFFNAWDQLAVNPESSAARSEVRQIATTMATTFNSLSQSLQTTRSEIDSEIGRNVTEINGYLGQIASLNQQIAATQTIGAAPNDLLDQRDTMLDKLSQLINIGSSVQADGQVLVTLGGRALVDGNSSEGLATVANGEGRYSDVVFRGDVVSSSALGGSVGALVHLRDDVIGRTRHEGRSDGLPDSDGIMAKLDIMANAVAQAVNSLHESGSGLNGSTGVAFFQRNVQLTPTAAALANPATAYDDTFIGADSITVSDAINDPVDGLNNIAAAELQPAGSSSGPGNNAIATAISSLRSDHTVFQGVPGGNANETGTFDDHYRSFLANLGVDGQKASRDAKNQSDLIDHLTAQRESVSGVNFDEEMSNLVKYQHAYNASAKVISVLDAVLDKLINGMPPGR